MILVDTGFWIALFNVTDRYHQSSIKAAEDLKQTLVTTWPVITETVHILQKRLGHLYVQKFLLSIEEGSADVHSLSSVEFSRWTKLITKYKELPMDIADASMVLLAEEVGTGNILSIDERDFKTYKWKNKAPFKNLLLNYT